MPVARVVVEINQEAVTRIGLGEARRRVTDMTRATFNRAMVLTPVASGNLRSHNDMRIDTRPFQIVGEVFNLVDYAAPVHNGSKAHVVRPKTRPQRVGTNSAGLPVFKGGVLRFVYNGRVVYARETKIPAQRPRPWLTRAMVQTAPRYGFKVVNLGPGGA